MATLSCTACGGRVFSEPVAAGEQALVCINCGRPFEPPAQHRFHPAPLSRLSPLNRKPQLW